MRDRSPLEIRELIDIAASPERVFRALTDPHELKIWWSDPAECVATHWEMDARVGGRWLSRWRWTSSGQEFTIGGTVLRVEPPRLVEYSWNDDRYPDVRETVVRFEIIRAPHGCRVTVTHRGFIARTPDYLDYSGGWRSVLEKLRRAAVRSGE